MVRHLRGRRARGRLARACAPLALTALCLGGCGLVPMAPFDRPADEAQAALPQPLEPPPAEAPQAAVQSAPAQPDLPEPGDRPAATPAAQPTAAPEESSAPAASAAPAQSPVVEPSPAERAVRAALDEFYSAYNSRDWKRARAQFWSGATISDVRILPDQPAPAVQVASVAEFFEELARTREPGPGGFQGKLVGSPVVRTASNVGQAWCHFEARFGGPQETMSWRRVDAFTFVLHEGHWKIASLAQSNSFDTQ